MTTVAEVERLAASLPEAERAALAAHLLRSLPPALPDGEWDDDDDEEGVAEALRRDAELEADPGLALSQAEFERHLATRRPR